VPLVPHGDAPGTGKTYFVQQIAASLPTGVRYHEVNLAKCTELEFRAALGRLSPKTKNWRKRQCSHWGGRAAMVRAASEMLRSSS
jgi:hypothetical protein